MEVLRRQFDVNVFGLVEVTRKVLANMRVRRTGTVVNVSSIGVRVKLVEPGGVNTDFGGRSFVFSNDESLEEYQPLVQAFTEAMNSMDRSENQEPEGVAEVIWKAATDDSDQLRYISGAGAQATLDRRYSYETEEAMLAAMNRTYGLR